MLLNKKFEYATLYAPTCGTWRISWYNIHPVTKDLTRIQKTFNLNRIKCQRERRQKANAIIATLNLSLQNGYNYFIDHEGLGDIKETSSNLSIGKLLEKVLAIRIVGRKKRTAESYESLTNVFAKWLQENKLYNLPSALFTKEHFRKYITYKNECNRSNRHINDNINYFKTTFRIAVKEEYIEHNPIANIEFLPEQESTRFEPLTEQELTAVATRLQEYDKHFFLYTKMIAHEFIRPYHNAFIKCNDIMYDKDLVASDNTSSKNSKVKYKQLMPDVKKLLIELGYHQATGNFYLFGRDFTPSKKSFEGLSKKAAKIWKKVVKDELGIDKNMYALKHTGATYYVNENEQVNTQWLQSQMEHRDLAETETYISKRTLKNIDPAQVKRINY